ncbi:sulfotransferase family 2 domain-containing protein [Oscillatoria sp. CS-180]|uniref:sulfotransferase family 2 domain-containing protein n=1 Tax=Oscillatoria sp. CS-180 TaxID=3021720 RepID=UPI00232B1114|nr:sulfotransferase family 2 domain-containing protein [Oscillatoria sp. CS-180]MDB9526418.1 sulfotransferase family 2 domain-containing protein [Oscillatoria sp. CS-180]
MLISEKYKFIFIHIHKNAGISIKHALRPFAVEKWQPFAIGQWQWRVHKRLKKKGFPSPFFEPHPFHGHIKASEMIDALGFDAFNSFFSFAVVRNPWDWQVSLYKYMLKRETHYQHEFIKSLGSFENYIKWRCENEVRYQKDFIYSEDNRLLVDFVGRYENLNADFNQICSRIGVSTSLPKLNVSDGRPYRHYYTEETKELVGKVFEPDVKILDYTF